MQVFLAIKVQNPRLVEEKIAGRYAGSCYQIDDSTFLIATEGETTRQVATNIGLGDGEPENVTSGIVMPVTSYWGRYDPDLWDWINVMQRSNGRS